ncbi:MAG: hypothetical protein CXT74_05305 [Methanobacteriota archaeon]|nr:MAG: hypothetical protein CXT74_05305 [Euryarchaeota archaeon]
MTWIVGFAIGFAYGFQVTTSGGSLTEDDFLIIMVISYSIIILYHTFFISSEYQGTPGKILLGIKVVDYDGQRVSVAKAFGRTLSYIPSAILLGIGFLMIGFTDKKQGLHDYLARTYAVRETPKAQIQNQFDANTDNFQRGGSSQTFDPSKDSAAQLKDLKELLDGGIITPSEFEEEKRKILR